MRGRTAGSGVGVKADQHERNGLVPHAKRQLNLAAVQSIEEFEDTPMLYALITFFCYAYVIVQGHVHDLLRYLGLESNPVPHERNMDGFPPLYSDFDSFFTRNLYTRIRDCWNRPIASAPGRYIDILERETPDGGWTFRLTGRRIHALNLGSYNYLGFSETTGPCVQAAEAALHRWGIATGSPRVQIGMQRIHEELEQLVAAFVGKPAAVVIGMGFATNSTVIPALVGPKCLVFSDEMNHASIVLGARLSGARIIIFKHNNPADLERKLRVAIADGQPVSHRPWKKILIIVEGIYSMEGSICRLDEIVRIKKKYKAYLFLDEAHSIGALGPTGCGVTEHLGIDPADVDIMMGTLTKSFAGSGGYCAATRDIVDHIKCRAHSSVYAETISPVVAQQVISSMRIIMGLDGTDDGRRRIQQLADNARYMRQHLKRMGFIVYGNDASPIVPLLLYNPSKIPAFSRMCLERNLGVVVVGFPAVPILSSRTRFCVSASHTRADLDRALREIDEIGTLLGLKISCRHAASSFQPGP